MAIPKGSSIAQHHRRLLDAPSIRQGRCCICGSPRGALHHIPAKSQVPKAFQDRVPVISVCGRGNRDSCHGLLHMGDVVPSIDGGTWWFMVPTPERNRRAYRESMSARANIVEYISDNRTDRGLKPIRMGVCFPAYIELEENV